MRCNVLPEVLHCFFSYYVHGASWSILGKHLTEEAREEWVREQVPILHIPGIVFNGYPQLFGFRRFCFCYVSRIGTDWIWLV